MQTSDREQICARCEKYHGRHDARFKTIRRSSHRADKHTGLKRMPSIVASVRSRDDWMTVTLNIGAVLWFLIARLTGSRSLSEATAFMSLLTEPLINIKPCIVVSSSSRLNLKSRTNVVGMQFGAAAAGHVNLPLLARAYRSDGFVDARDDWIKSRLPPPGREFRL